MTLPLLLVFLFAVLDLGRVVFFQAEASTAAHAAARYLKEHEGVASEKDIQAAAQLASPALGTEGVTLAVATRTGEVEQQESDHHIYDVRSSEFVTRSARMKTQQVDVVVEVEGLYVTPLGTLLGNGASRPAFLCTAMAHITLDVAVEGGMR